jgi:hypothetical protein
MELIRNLFQILERHFDKLGKFENNLDTKYQRIIINCVRVNNAHIGVYAHTHLDIYWQDAH